VGDSRRRPNRKVWFFLSSAVACLASGTATAACVVPSDTPAGTVPCRIVVQPIDVCEDTGTKNCALFNTSPEGVGDPSDQNQITNPIGFVDQATGINITRAMLNQVGVDVTFLPIATYNNTMFQMMNVIDDAANQACRFPGGTLTGFTSCDFLTLSQQPNISQVVGFMPTPPLAAEATVINMFFVNRLIPPPSQAGGILYGFSWINNNGIAIGGDTFFPPFRLPPRFDTLAHEIGHNLALPHNDFGAGTPPNLESAGCCTSTGFDLRTEPASTGDALVQLDGGGGMGTADQLTLASQESAVLPVSQQTEVLMSGFVSAVPNSMMMAMEPETRGAVATASTGGLIAAAAPTPAANLATGADSKWSSSIEFEVLGPVTAGSSNETLTAVILMLPKGLKFDLHNPFHAFVNPQYVAETEILQGNSVDMLHGFCVDPADFDQVHGDVHGLHKVPATQCLLIEFKQPGLQRGQVVRFTIGILIGGGPITIGELAGGDITFIFGSDTYATTAALTGPVAGQLMAGSQQPDLRISSRYVDPSKVAGTGASPCTVAANLTHGPVSVHTTGCPDPRMTGIEDGNPSHEGGQPQHQPHGGGIH
jgi:hypothetical protein